MFEKEKHITGGTLYHSKDLGMAFVEVKGDILRIIFYPSKNSYPMLCNNEKAKKFSSGENLFGIDELDDTKDVENK